LKIDLDDLVAVAKVARPRGIRGEIVADILTDFPDRFDGLRSLIAVTADGRRRELTIEALQIRNGRLHIRFAGLDSIEAAEEIRNCDLCVPESEAVSLNEDEFYDWQLTDCRVETVTGEKIGIVSEIMRAGGPEILVVSGVEKEYMIPFVTAICVEVDIGKKLIRIDPPDGLLEF
jgi:16S rRNA processing protein RimM